MSRKAILYLIYLLSAFFTFFFSYSASSYDQMSLDYYLQNSSCSSNANSNCSYENIAGSNQNIGAISKSLIAKLNNILDKGDNGQTQSGYKLTDTVNFFNTINESRFVNCLGSYDDCINGVIGSYKYTTDITQATISKTRVDSSSGVPCPVIKCDIKNGGISGNFYLSASPNSEQPLIYNFNLDSQDVDKDISIGNGITLRLIQMVGANCLTMLVPGGYNYIACKNNFSTLPPPASPNIFCFGTTACSIVGENHSLFPLPITGKMVECVKDTVEYLFNGSASKCPGGDKNQFNLLQTLQNNLRPAVLVGIILYTIFFGINIALGDKLISKGEFFGYIIKIVAVLYFSVGIKDNTGKYQSGIDQYVYGGFYAIMNSFSNFIMSGSSGSLCNFAKVMKEGQNPYIDPKTGEDYSSLSLWDSLDCTLAYTTGLAAVGKNYYFYITQWQNALNKINNSYSTGYNQIQMGQLAAFETFFSADIQFGSDAINTFLPLLGILAIVTFNFMFVIMIGIYIAFLVSIIFYFVKLFIMAIVALALMSYLAVIFVPFSLFSHTKPYFDKWLSITLSFSLQPVVVVAFLSLLLGIFNDIIFPGCVWGGNENGQQYTNFNLGGGNNYYFWLLPSDQPDSCKNSFGYVLYNASSARIQTFDALFMEFSLLNGQAIASLTNGLLKSIMYIFFFYFFAQKIGAFAAQITNGAMIPAGKPTEFFDKAMKFVKDSVTKGAAGAAAGKSDVGMAGKVEGGSGGAPRGGVK